MVWEVMVTAALLGMAGGNYPQFDANAQMSSLLLPADAKVGSVIYRLRATDSDRDYPLKFAATDYGSYVVRLEDLPCSRSSPACEANVFLERSVAPGQVFKFRLTVRDTSGDTTTSGASIRVTDGVTDFQNVFPHVPGVIMIPEDTKVGTELEYVLVKKHPRSLRPAKLELVEIFNNSIPHKGAEEFEIKQTSKKDTTTGVIILSLPLDYEVKTMYKLAIYAMGMWTDTDTDTRNVAGFELVVVVSDVQDTPPIWDAIAPITVLNPNITKGDMVLKVTARDGDRGAPREVRYALAAEKNPFTVFFDIHPVTGEIRLVRTLKELTTVARSHQPILLTVVAEEVVVENRGVADSSTATVALLLGELGNSPPYFESMSYSAHLPENSPQGTPVVFPDPYIPTVKDNDMGKHGVFALSLENNNGTFEISPSVGEREVDFVIRVRDNRLLDFEKRRQLVFKIWAREVNPSESPLSTSVDVTIFITDENDNPPVFAAANYTAEAPENATAGGFTLWRGWPLALPGWQSRYYVDGHVPPRHWFTSENRSSVGLLQRKPMKAGSVDVPTAGSKPSRLVRVEASDVDTGDFGVVKFTGIIGNKNSSLNISPDSGLITIAVDNHGFDREQSSTYRFNVEARDNKGLGNRATVALLVIVLDVNDNVPKFVKNPMEFILGPEGVNFSQPAFVKAFDDDAEPPNNVVRYEILSGNYNNRFLLDQETGELKVNLGGRRARQAADLVANLLVRAYDLGVPTLWTTGEVRIFPAESQARVMRFLLPGQNLDRKSVEAALSEATGAKKVIIHSIQPYNGQLLPGHQATDLSPNTGEKTIVTATILFDKNAVVDLEEIQKRFTGIKIRNTTSVIITQKVDPEPVYRTETGVLFWILLILLLLLLLGILSLILCCLCSWCPYYAFFHSLVRKKSSSRSHMVTVAAQKDLSPERENKSVQAEWLNGRARREAWSADDRRIWAFGGNMNSPRRLLLLPERGYHHHQQQPNPVYVRQVEEPVKKPRPRREDPLLLEDIEGTEYQVLDPSRLREPSTRQTMFIRDGGAEILRLVTRGRNGSEEEPELNQPQRPFTLENKETEGKATIMKRFINDTNEQHTHSKEEGISKVEDSKVKISEGIKEEEEEGEKREDLMKRVMDLDVERSMSTADINRLTSIQRDLLLTRFLVEEQRRARVEDTQSLPGVVAMATQTDKHAETQTDKVYFKRKSKSDNDDSPSDSEESAKRKMRRRRKKQDGTIEFRPASRIDISSPIFEEGEESRSQGVNHTKASLIRQTAVKSKMDDETSKFRSNSDHEATFRRREVLRSLQVTPIKQMNITNNILVEHVRYRDPPSLTSQETNTESVDFLGSSTARKEEKGFRSQSVSPFKDSRSLPINRKETSPRYMDWYKTKKEMREKQKREQDPNYRLLLRNKPKTKSGIEGTRGRERRRWSDKEEQDGTPKRVAVNIIPEVVREEFTKVSKNEKRDEDKDSGIAVPYPIGPTQLKNQQRLEKKSIFTIAYDDMETKKINIDSASTP